MKQKALILLPLSLSLFAYDKNTDYQEKINQAVAEGNYQAAALYEQQRNEKIAGEGMNYQQTSNYSQYLGGGNGGNSGGNWVGGNAGYQGQYNPSKDYDYAANLQQLMNAGYSDADYLEQLLNERTLKAMDNAALGKYANDAFSTEVRNYINNLRANQFDLDSILAKIEGAIGPAPSYSSDWDDTKNLLAQAALDMKYEDWANSDQYKALADRYGQQGKLSMQDLLGQVASRTGGLASSYAATVADQQYNDYMAQLEEVARQMYAGERSDAIQNAQMAYDFADSDYQRYLDQLAQYNGDRSYAYQVLSDALAQSNYNREWQNTLEQQEYNRGQASRNEAQQRIENYIAAGGSTANLDPALIESSGYSAAELAALEQYYTAQNTPKATGGSGGGGGGGSKKTTQSDDYANVRKKAMGYDDAGDAEAYLNRMVDGGYITEDEAYNIFMIDLGGDTGSSGGNDMLVPTTYEEFAAKTGNPGIMTKTEFARAKASNGGRASGYTDYQDYLAKMWEKYKPTR